MKSVLERGSAWNNPRRSTAGHPPAPPRPRIAPEPPVPAPPPAPPGPPVAAPAAADPERAAPEPLEPEPLELHPLGPEPAVAPPEPKPAEVKAQPADDVLLTPVVLDDDAPVRNSYLRPEFTTTDQAFTVRIINEERGIDWEFPCEPGEYVLEAADRAGYELPSSCRNGGCLTCTGRLIEGECEMADQYVLEDEHIEDGFRLLCCTSVTTDAVFRSHQEGEVH